MCHVPCLFIFMYQIPGDHMPASGATVHNYLRYRHHCHLVVVGSQQQRTAIKKKITCVGERNELPAGAAEAFSDSAFPTVVSLSSAPLWEAAKTPTPD